jgi:hypothetical protein
METSLDRFDIGREDVRALRVFQPSRGQRPLAKLRDISDDLAAHVTQIYGRPELHAMMDLAFHSALAFNFSGKGISHGWLDVLVVGDTRTGKSEAATRMTRHYGAGEVVSCESASFAGIIGGLQQFGASKEWAITWGQIPINDRRLVVLDEVSGLSFDDIAQRSSVRSSGRAELSKIQQERTFARTRLIWLGNPRNGKMSDYTYGVQSIAPLIGNPEDVARFDLAMTVRAGDVPSSEINREHERRRQRYSEEACRLMIRWAWSRTAEQIVWTDGATEEVYKASNKMGGEYIEDPPLIQAANVREKIARVAPGSKVFCRILCDGSGAEWPLSRKFGCVPEMAARVLEHAHRLGLVAYGLSFHVGSQQRNPRMWDAALASSAEIVRDLAERGIHLSMVNLGGGFPTKYLKDVPAVKAYGQAIFKSLRKHFGNRIPAFEFEVFTGAGEYP